MVGPRESKWLSCRSALTPTLPRAILSRKSFLLDKEAMNFEITSLSSKGQVVIPSVVRDILGLPVGTKLAVFTDGENVLLQPIRKPSIAAFRELRKQSEQARKTADAIKAGKRGRK